jgi:hypothetical protein
VGSVGVVEERGREKGGKIDGDEDEQKGSPRSRWGVAERRARQGYRLSFGKRRECHLVVARGEGSE